MWLIYWYLRTLLFFGFIDYVYKLSYSWGSSSKISPASLRYNAVWVIQDNLFKLGFHKCPYCFWATRTKDEHILSREGYCYEQSIAPTEGEAHQHQMLLDSLGEDPMTWQ